MCHSESCIPLLKRAKVDGRRVEDRYFKWDHVNDKTTNNLSVTSYSKALFLCHVYTRGAHVIHAALDDKVGLLFDDFSMLNLPHRPGDSEGCSKQTRNRDKAAVVSVHVLDA